MLVCNNDKKVVKLFFENLEEFLKIRDKYKDY